MSCDTILDAELWAEYADTVHAVGEDEYTAELKSVGDSSIMHFLIPKNTEKSTLRVHSSCGDNCTVSLHVTAGDQLVGRRINGTETIVDFRPYEDESIHYVTLRLLSGVASNVTVSLRDVQEVGKNLTEVGLTRETAADFFRFDYEHLVGNGSKPVPMNLTEGMVSVMRFKVGAVYDTGGTLFVGLKNADEKNEKSEKVILVGCVSYGEIHGLNKIKLLVSRPRVLV